MRTVYKWLMAWGVVLGMTACDEQINPSVDEMLSSGSDMEATGDGMSFTDIHFSDDNKVMTLSGRLMHDIGGYDLTDSSTVVAKLQQEVKWLPGKYVSEPQPVITQVSNSSKVELHKLDLKILVLVDLSLPQSLIDAECNAIWEMRTQFSESDLYVAFMQGGDVSETYEATDYVLENYFVHREPSSLYLYRSILTKLNEMNDNTTTIGKARNKVMVILSGGKTYDGELPVDPKHYELQQLLMEKIQQYQGKMLAYYANFASTGNSNDQTIPAISGTDEANILHYLCKGLNGIYQTSFNWQEMVHDILKDSNIDLTNYKITIEQPDGKIFRGNLRLLQISFYEKKSGDLIVKGSTYYSLGTVYNPIIVRDDSKMSIMMDGIMMTLFNLLLAWLLLQFLEPYIRYQLFKRKYIIKYSGSKMSYNGQVVSESCYFCKSPFEVGDEIVVKCKHTMHKECWDDNEYHCPEHGRHCKEGSHYYNQQNLTDSRNAKYYLKWVLVAIIAAFVTWCFFVTQGHNISASIIQEIDKIYNHFNSGSTETTSYFFSYGSHMSDLPAFGHDVGFVLTFFLSYFTVRHRKWLYRLIEMLIRATIAGVAGTVSSLLGCFIFIALHLDSSPYLIDWIPWALLSCVIMLATTVKTPTPIRRSFWMAACLIAIISMIMWGFIYYNSFINYRLSLLLGFIAYAIAIAISIASVTPNSERFFLHVEGAIKEMDIALYKWFKSSSDRVVTIGKSVDCSIQLSWDINGKVAPIQAEIRKYRSSLRLHAIDEGIVVDNKTLEPGKEEWLYHGRKFTIGNTTFTYIEKDLKN